MSRWELARIQQRAVLRLLNEAGPDGTTAARVAHLLGPDAIKTVAGLRRAGHNIENVEHPDGLRYVLHHAHAGQWSDDA